MKCAYCEGRGYVVEGHDVSDAFAYECPDCLGTGMATDSPCNLQSFNLKTKQTQTEGFGPMANYVDVYLKQEKSTDYTYQTYQFKTDLDLKVGDDVVVETRYGLTIGRVAFVPSESGYQGITKWVVCKIDVEAHERRKQAQAKRAEVKAKMQAMYQDLSEQAMYEVLAEKYPQMKELLDQFKALEDV